jgi:hypothetical protein
VQALNLNVEDLGARPIYPGGFVLDHGNYPEYLVINVALSGPTNG